MIFWRRSLPMFEPVDEIGIAEPAFVVGESAATSAPCMITKPALAARAPSGHTYTTTGSLAASSALMICSIEVERPPGVSSRSTKAAAC